MSERRLRSAIWVGVLACAWLAGRMASARADEGGGDGEGADALSAGGTTLEEDLAAAEAEGEEAEVGADAEGGQQDEGDERPWNASFDWQHAFTANTLNPGAQLAYNPTYSWTFTLMGSYELNEDVNVRAHVPFGVELTPSEGTTTEREFWIYDVVLDAPYTGLPKVAGFKALIGPRVYLPLAPSSQAANRVLGLGVFGSVKRRFDLGSGMMLVPSVGFSYRRWFASRNVVSVDEPFRCRVLDSGLNVTPQCTQYPGPTPIRDTLSLNLSLMFHPMEALSFTSGFVWYWHYGFGLADAVVEVDGTRGGVVTLPDRSLTHMRGETLFELAVGYDVTKFLHVTAALNTPAPHLDTDGRPENPFWNERSQLLVTASVGLGALYHHLGSEQNPEEHGERHTASASSGEEGAL